MEHGRTAQAILWTVAFLAVGALLRPLLPERAVRRGVEPTEFGLRKLAAGADYDVVVAGDSRVETGVSPDHMRSILGEVRVLNFGFGACGYDDRYLDLVDEKLAEKGRRVLVLAVSPFSLTPAAARQSSFLSLLERPFTVADALAEPLDRFRPIGLSDAVDWLGFESGRPHSEQEYREDGWLRSDQHPGDPTRTVPSFRAGFQQNQVSPRMVAGLLERVGRWTNDGVRVVGVRMPTSEALRAVEDELSGMDWAAFRQRFEDAGGTWLDGLSERADYRTYDGSHLDGSSALLFSETLAARLAPFIRR